MKKLFLIGIIGVGILFGAASFLGAFSHSGKASMRTNGNSGAKLIQANDIGAAFSKDAAQPFQFSTGSLTGTISQHAISPSRDAEYILDHYKACGPKYRPASYFPDMASTMKKLPETAYTLGTYQIILMPNLLGYKNLPAVQEDFFFCPGATGTLVPAAMNDNWLVFSRSCDTSDDACTKAAAIINPTIQLK